MPILNVKSTAEYKSSLSTNKTTVVLFSADWADQCKQVENVLDDLQKAFGDIVQFININAEDFPDISSQYQIDAVPTVIFFTNGSPVDRVDGINIAQITTKLKKICPESTPNVETLNESLKKLINKAPVMVFMKGDRNAPRCGFSKQLISIMDSTQTAYETFDVLKDENVRQGLKTFSDWPTYPQVYVKGELIGGLDIIKELLANNELENTLKG